MGNSRLYRFLSRIADIRPGEESMGMLLFAYFFLITSPHTIIKAIRYADLLDKFDGIEGLPLGYLLAALITGVVVLLQTRLQARLRIETLSILSLVFFMLSGLLLSLLIDTGGKVLSLIFWVWAYVLTVMVIAHFWLTVYEAFNPREAKRLIGFFGSGGLLGGVVGGLVARAFSRPELAKFSLPLACLLLFLSIFVIRAIYAKLKGRTPRTRTMQTAPPELVHPQKTGFRDSWQLVRKNRYLLIIASVVMLTVIVSTLIDLQFNSVIDIKFSGREAKQAFFGLFYAGLTIFAFLVQILLTSNLLKTFGIRNILLLAPVLLLACTIGTFAFPLLLATAIAVKGSEESLAFSLNQSVREILYIPVSSAVRAKAKMFIDVFLNRFAKAVGAVLIFGILGILELAGHDAKDPGSIPYIVRTTGIVVVIILALWFALNIRAGSQYVDAVKDNIRLKWGRADKDVSEKLDLDYTKLVFDTIESKSRSSVLYAMHMYDLLKRDKLTPEIKALISQKSDEVKAASISDMFNAEGAMWFPDTEDDICQEDFQANIQEIMSLDDYQRVMKSHADHVMEESRKAVVEKMELAKVIDMMHPDAPLVGKLEALIRDDSPEVARYAVESAAKLRKPEHIPALIQKLGNPLTREDAITALNKYGEAAIKPMDDYLADHHKDIELRRALVTALARFGSQEAADILMRDLDRKASDLDTEIIDALDRVRSERPDIHIPERIAKRETHFLIEKYYKAFLELEHEKTGKQDDEYQARLRRRLETYFRDIFKLLGLYYPYEDIAKAYQNIERGTRESMAYAVELLDNSLKKELRDLILPLIEDLSSEERGRRFQQILRNFPRI